MHLKIHFIVLFFINISREEIKKKKHLELIYVARQLSSLRFQLLKNILSKILKIEKKSTFLSLRM